jgi:hypothetical protein
MLRNEIERKNKTSQEKVKIKKKATTKRLSTIFDI